MIIIRGALAVTMDERLGDLQQSDIVINGDRIEAIGLSGQIESPDADIVDGRGKIAIPGLINAHMHTWQTALRSVASNWTLSSTSGRCMPDSRLLSAPQISTSQRSSAH